ncbi:hypothetical protein M885DRAFT_465421 [Pelagophyceae sp. CCMP2097]|nr:hypothetical protein M885DRAFT_465421 [Pelagophyceae sp. CCMP2097]
MLRLLALFAVAGALGVSRRSALETGRRVAAATVATVAAPAFVAGPASARNLPESNGASGDKRGGVEALLPVVQIARAVDAALAVDNADLAGIKRCLAAATIPRDEKDFKRLFDEYSEGVSYKQTFLDQNAFLVYYTKGFDGPGRGSIEAPTPAAERETKQYGARNDAWVAVDDARAEVDYLISEKSADTLELVADLTAAKKALDAYLALAPPADVQTARLQLQR